MDTVIANKYSDILSTLNIEVSKKLEGVYEVDEIYLLSEIISLIKCF